MKAVLALLGALFACQTVSATYGGIGYGGIGYGGLGYGGLGYGGYGGGYGVGIVEEIVEPVIPISGGLVDARSYVDSYLPGSSYCGYGTYGPAYGGLGYPLDVYGPIGPIGGGLGYGGLGYGGLGGLGYGGGILI
uniref:Uncharacterized protein n=1 Tax=Graphocephala atropunctata TaxID=36148 RepID=A0A1B6M4X0_9HEMI